MPRHVITVTGDTLAELAAAYNRGLSIRDLASERSWSYGAAHKYLRVAADRGLTTVRSRGARRGVSRA